MNKGDKKFHKVLREYSEGKLKSKGKKVTNYKQALAIAFSEARSVDPKYGGSTSSPTKKEYGEKLSGPSHADGGIPGIIKETGQPIEVEGDEMIINKRSTRIKDYIVCRGNGEGIGSALNELGDGKKWSNEGTCEIVEEVEKFKKGKMIPKLENAVVFDNGGETLDRYTILIKPTGEILGSSENPFHGFGQHVGNVTDRMNITYGYGWRKGRDEKSIKKITKSEVENYIYEAKKEGHLGKEVKDLNSLPSEVKKFILQEQQEEKMKKGNKIKSHIDKNKNEKIERMIIRDDELKKMENGERIRIESIMGILNSSSLEEAKSKYPNISEEKINEIINLEKSGSTPIEITGIVNEKNENVNLLDRIYFKINEPKEFEILEFLYPEHNFRMQKALKTNDILVMKKSDELEKFLDKYGIHYTEFESQTEIGEVLIKMLPERIKKKLD